MTKLYTIYGDLIAEKDSTDSTLKELVEELAKNKVSLKDFNDYLNDIKRSMGVPDDELEDEDGITISTAKELAAKYEKGMKSIYGDDVMLESDDKKTK